MSKRGNTVAEITLAGIRKSFDETHVLRGIDLDIRDGEFLTLVGPSGCGKSTLLRIIAGLEDQSDGDVTIGSRLVNGIRASERDLAMVFQSYALYPHLSVADNMMTPLRLRDLNFWQRLPVLGPFLPGSRTKLSAMRAAVQETADTLKIETLLQRKPGQLSGGQRQRVALGRAMVRRPAAFLMDEPLSNLDAALRVHMRAELTELHRSLDTTFIYVTHDQAEALTMSTRMAVMMEGRILQLDSPTRIYDDPADLKVAEFVGSPCINILEGEITQAGQVYAHGQQLLMSLPGHRPQPVRIGIRPENLTLASPTSPKPSLEGTVKLVEHLGSDVYVHALIGEGKPPLVLRSSPDGARDLTYGSPVRITGLSRKPQVFDVRGQRLRPPAAVEGRDPDREVA